MAGLSYIDINEKGFSTPASTIPLDESVGGMLFDISGFPNPFASFAKLYSKFKDGQIQCVNNMDEVEALGITDSFLNGVPYYHISQFYDYIGDNQVLYLCFADCSENWESIASMQRQCSGKLFQVGVWTSQPLWIEKANGDYAHTNLIANLQAQANEINGEVGKTSQSPTPLSIVLCGNSNSINNANYHKIPNAIDLDCPKVSVILAQNGTSSVHSMQSRNPANTPVGVLGLAMACLAICGAEKSIGSAMDCDLNKNEKFSNPEWGFGDGYLPIDKITRSWANTISSKGYIIPISYPDLEASYFFSNDQTLSTGKLSSIANNRILHKCRRAVYSALLPYVNSNHLYSSGSKTLSPTAQATITASINALLDSALLNKDGKRQISSRNISFSTNGDLLENDALELNLSINPINYSSFISESVTPLSI